MKPKDISHCPSCGALCSKSEKGDLSPMSQRSMAMHVYDLTNQLDIIKTIAGPDHGNKSDIVAKMIKLARGRKLAPLESQSITDEIIDLVYELERLTNESE